ncbi:beta-eliminating lyase-related protein [Paenibacillus sp. TRM 82003]|nr:beta-eliminating lyase-related protein [Paenibacillus sp. TRM 82003]
MHGTNELQDAFRRAAYPLGGHGPRNLQVLKDALDTADGSDDSDLYGAGLVIEGFQAKIARILGKEAAVFFPSGTMAQQIALRIWCDRSGTKRVAYHPLCHLEIHEQDGLKELHGIEPVLLANERRTILLDDVLSMQEDVACVLLELPQREIGGVLPPYEDLVGISAHCREKGIKLHLDGARLFEVLPYYSVTAEEICALFDSVYVSFYKGIGGVAGAMLAGDASFTEASKVWKRRHGGDLISLYPYIVSADYYFGRRAGEMGRYYEYAKELAAAFAACRGAEVRPEVPVSNMFHVHFRRPKAEMETLLAAVYVETDVAFTGSLKETEGGCCFEMSLGDRYADAPKSRIEAAIRLLDERLEPTGNETNQIYNQ